MRPCRTQHQQGYLGNNMRDTKSVELLSLTYLLLLCIALAKCQWNLVLIRRLTGAKPRRLCTATLRPTVTPIRMRAMHTEFIRVIILSLPTIFIALSTRDLPVCLTPRSHASRCWSSTGRKVGFA